MNAWRQIADVSDARAYGSSASLGSTVFAVGGLQSDMQVGRLCLFAGELSGRSAGLQPSWMSRKLRPATPLASQPPT